MEVAEENLFAAVIPSQFGFYCLSRQTGRQGDTGLGPQFDRGISDPGSPTLSRGSSRARLRGGRELGSHPESIRRAGRARAPGPAAEERRGVRAPPSPS